MRLDLPGNRVVGIKTQIGYGECLVIAKMGEHGADLEEGGLKRLDNTGVISRETPRSGFAWQH